uniref:Uncharacterized protein n=1 Tax=Pseudomonas phage PACT201 TaxID=3230130 RepID=A0AAU8GS96_9VIRU
MGFETIEPGNQCARQAGLHTTRIIEAICFAAELWAYRNASCSSVRGHCSDCNWVSGSSVENVSFHFNGDQIATYFLNPSIRNVDSIRWPLTHAWHLEPVQTAFPKTRDGHQIL